MAGCKTGFLCTLLQSLMGCILPLMHFRSQHCWELLYRFALHYQQGCVRLHVASLSFVPKEEKLHTYTVFPLKTRSNQSLGECVQHVFKVIWKLVYWLRCESVAYHFTPLLCDTRLLNTARLLSTVFQIQRTRNLSEMTRPMFHHSTSGLIFKNGDKQKQIKCFNSF